MSKYTPHRFKLGDYVRCWDKSRFFNDPRAHEIVGIGWDDRGYPQIGFAAYYNGEPRIFELFFERCQVHTPAPWCPKPWSKSKRWFEVTENEDGSWRVFKALFSVSDWDIIDEKQRRMGCWT